jgi:hypothetical protein
MKNLAPLRSATCREPQGRAIGMMESWVLASGSQTLRLGENIGMVGLENQNEYNCIWI